MTTLYYYLVIILPIVLEGFPVSSSGHVELLMQFLSADDCLLVMQQIPRNVDHILHGPIVCIILTFFYKEWIYFLYNIRYYFFACVRLACFIALTTAITAGGYFLLHGTPATTFPLYYGYGITTIFLFSLFFCRTLYNATLSFSNALILGVVQALSLLPGISRFGSTFVTARWLGFSPEHAFRLSFLMELPISCAAFLKGILSQHAGTYYDLLQMKFLLTILSASCLGLGGFYIVSHIIRADKVWMFGIYTLFLVFVSWILQ